MATLDVVIAIAAASVRKRTVASGASAGGGDLPAVPVEKFAYPM